MVLTQKTNMGIQANTNKAVSKKSIIQRIPFTILNKSQNEIGFVVRDSLPNNVSFISLFVIGQLYYLNNQYKLGYEAFDAARNIRDVVD